MSRSNAAAAILFLLDDDDLRAVQWMRGLAEKTDKKRCNLEKRIWKTGKSTVIPLGLSGLSPHGVQNGMPITRVLKSRTYFGSIRHGTACHSLSKNFPKYFRMWNFHYAYADEDLGFNTGRGTARNGEIDMTIPEGGSNEAFEIMFL